MKVDFVRSVQRLSVKRAERWHEGAGGWSVLEWAGAMCGEAGEAANVAKKMRRLEQGIVGNEVSERKVIQFVELRDKLANECADVFCYLVLLAASQEIDLQDAIVRTFNKKSLEMGWSDLVIQEDAS